MAKNARKKISMKVEISDGELLDKLSILEIKALFIKDEQKLTNVQREIEELKPLCVNLFVSREIKESYEELKNVNLKLWEIEDSIRIKEKEQEFDDEFIRLARGVYFTNDLRAEIKKRINLFSRSYLVEEKSYVNYK